MLRSIGKQSGASVESVTGCQTRRARQNYIVFFGGTAHALAHRRRDAFQRRKREIPNFISAELELPTVAS